MSNKIEDIAIDVAKRVKEVSAIAKVYWMVFYVLYDKLWREKEVVEFDSIAEVSQNFYQNIAFIHHSGRPDWVLRCAAKGVYMYDLIVSGQDE